MIFDALHLLKHNQISFWDGLVVSAATAANCTGIITEDLQDGFHINGLVVRSPFTD